MAQAVARFDGFVEKFVGDAVMAVFGAPRAHEDDPARAVDAALDMLQGIDELSHRWASRLSRPVTLHIGVHTGAVVAGSLGTGAGGTYAVTGDTVNTASRLLNAAEPGTVLVSAATQALTRHRFDFAAPSELTLRGKSQPLQVFRVMGVRSDSANASPRGLSDLGLAAPMVGRDAQLNQLLIAFDAMQDGRAQVVTVVGEAGAGKSRLLAEFFSRLEEQRRDALASTGVRRAACSSMGEPTYGSFGALFRDAYQLDQSDSLATAQHKLQEGLRGLGADASEADAITRVLQYLLGLQSQQPADIEPEQLQRQISLAARALLERRLAQQPLMIVLDDVHWADAASLSLLSDAIDQLADRPLMLLLSQRPDARATRATRAQHTQVQIDSLGAADTRVLLDQLLGTAGDAAMAPVRDLVVARAGGNPLFVEEIVRGLAGAGQLQRDGAERWQFDAGTAAPDVPATLYGLLLSRIDRLGQEDRRVLQEAAVLGSAFDKTLLQRIASAQPSVIDAALDRLAAAELLRADADSSAWRFTHALLHEVAYQNLLLARRIELHGRAGQALEEELKPTNPTSEASDPQALRTPRRLAELEALGHHWSLSHDKLRGARYLLAAGDWARSVYANDDAMRHYQRALCTVQEEASSVGGESKAARCAQLDASERLADLQGLAGRRDEALSHYAAIRQALGAQGREPVREARVLRKIGDLHWEAGERDRAATCFNEGLAALGEEGDAIERAHLFQELGRLAFRAGDNAAAMAWAHRALEEVAPTDTDTDTERTRAATIVRAEASNTLGVALARLGRTEEAVQHIEHSVAQAEAQDLLQAACRSYTNLGVLYATLDPQRSIETCLRGLQTARKVGDLAFQSRLYANLAVAYCALTNQCEAEGIEAAQAAVQLDRRLGLVDHLAVPLIVLGQIHQCHGDHERAFAAYQEALALAEQVAEPQLLFPCYDGLATLYLDAGRPDQAEAWLAKAQALCEGAGLEPDALMVLPFLC